MKVESSINNLQSAISIAKKSGQSVGFVPTMGNLHDGHIALVKEAKARCDFVVVSIFVNPTQFGENEDLDSYPRTLDADYEKLNQAGCNLVFVPDVPAMYTDNRQIFIQVGELANQLCGKSRPGHFDGVATIVTKLFNCVRPDMAVFGEKDYQQLAIIRKLNEELNFGIEILGVPIVREPSGLAMSSRNGYLSDEEKQTAANLSKCLTKIGSYLEQGINSYDKMIKAAKQHLVSKGFEVDYLEIKNLDLSDVTTESTEFVVLVAATIGSTRLIDNMTFKQE